MMMMNYNKLGHIGFQSYSLNYPEDWGRRSLNLRTALATWGYRVHTLGMCVWLCIMCPQCLWKPERASDALGLELQRLWAAIWMMGMKPRSSGRATIALNYWAIIFQLHKQNSCPQLNCRHINSSVYLQYLMGNCFIAISNNIQRRKVDKLAEQDWSGKGSF